MIYYENHVYSAISYPTHLFPIPFGLPIRVVSVRDTSSHSYMRILFQHTHTKKNSFYLNW